MNGQTVYVLIDQFDEDYYTVVGVFESMEYLNVGWESYCAKEGYGETFSDKRNMRIEEFEINRVRGGVESKIPSVVPHVWNRKGGTDETH